MPHSTASEPMFSEDLTVGDSFLPDAPEQVPDPAKEEEKMRMNDDTSHFENSMVEASRTDVKLEDLFNDDNDDEDDDFSGFGISESNKESSPPEAPL